MSKVLPQAIIDGIAGNSERVLLVRLIPEGGDSWSEFDWATKDITVTAWEGGDDKVFLGGILEENAFDPISQSVDILEGGNVGTISGLKIRVANPQFSEDSGGDLRFDQEVDTYNFENRTVEIWLAFWTGTNPAYTEILLLYRGVIIDVEYDYGAYVFKIENAEIKRHKIIPQDTYPPLDYTRGRYTNYNQGSVIPLLYGHLSYTELVRNEFITDVVPIIRSDKTKEEYIVSQNKVAEPIYELYIYHSGADLFQLVKGAGTGGLVKTYGRPTIVRISDALIEGALWGTLDPSATGQGTKTDPSSIAWQNAADRDLATSLTLAANQKLYVLFSLPSEIGRIMEIPGWPTTNIQFICIFAKESFTGSSPYGKLRYYNPEWDNGVGGFSDGEDIIYEDVAVYDVLADKTAHGRLDDQSDQNHWWTVDELATYEFGIEMNAGCSGELKSIYLTISNTLVRLLHPLTEKVRWRIPNGGGQRTFTRTIAEPLDIIATSDSMCVDTNGAAFGSWIDGSSRNNSYNEGNLIDAGCWHIEAILRDELGLTDDDINVDSFDDIGDNGGARELWRFAKIIGTPKNSLEYIAEFCQNAAIIFFTDYQNKEKVVALGKRAGTVKTIDRTTIEENGIKVNLSPLNNVYNEFEILAGHHALNDSWGKRTFLTGSNSNLDSNIRLGTPDTYTGLCADSQMKYNMTRKWTFNAGWISRAIETNQELLGLETIREKLCKWFAEWFCYRKYIVEFETDGLDHIDLELGDQVKFDHTLLPEAIDNSAHFMLFFIKSDLNSDRMYLKFIQIPDLLP